MKSITILTSHYDPETGAGARRLSSIAEFLAQKRWQVTVITLLPSHPIGRIYDGYEVKTPYISKEKGVTVIRYRPWIVRKDSLFLRVLSETLFCIKAFNGALKLKNPIVLSSSPYMFLGLSGLVAAKLKGKKFVWDVRDLTWLYPANVGKKTYGLDKIVGWIMYRTAKGADALISPCDGILQNFNGGMKYSMVVPNGVSDEFFLKVGSTSSQGILRGPHPRVVYAGLFGFMQDLDVLVEASELLPDASFYLVGDGPEKENLVRTARGNPNITFLSHMNTDNLIKMYVDADILVCLLRKSPINRIAQPSKLWEFMATGKPVIYCGEGITAQMLKEYGIAKVVPPGSPSALAEAIKELWANPHEAKALGERGREFVFNERRRSVIYKHLELLLEELLCKG